MKAKKLVKKLHDMIDSETRLRKKNVQDLKSLLKKMKDKEKSLTSKLSGLEDKEKRKQLKLEISVLHAQRKKGLDTLKGLMK